MVKESVPQLYTVIPKNTLIVHTVVFLSILSNKHLQTTDSRLLWHLTLQYHNVDARHSTIKIQLFSNHALTFPRCRGRRRRGAAAHRRGKRAACSRHKHGRTFLSPPPWNDWNFGFSSESKYLGVFYSQYFCVFSIYFQCIFLSICLCTFHVFSMYFPFNISVYFVYFSCIFLLIFVLDLWQPWSPSLPRPLNIRNLRAKDRWEIQVRQDTHHSLP